MAQAGSNDKKTRGQKSRWTVPLSNGITSIMCHGLMIRMLILTILYRLLDTSMNLLYNTEHNIDAARNELIRVNLLHISTWSGVYRGMDSVCIRLTW